jgi:hypothetical protein
VEEAMMSEEIETPVAEGEAPAEERAPEGPLKIRIGPVRMYTECTLKLGGCKAFQMGVGNSFPVDHHHKNLQKPIALACSSCLTKMQRDGKWIVP